MNKFNEQFLNRAVWTDKNGIERKSDEIDDNYLQNCINLAKRRNDIESLDIFKSELLFRQKYKTICKVENRGKYISTISVISPDELAKCRGFNSRKEMKEVVEKTDCTGDIEFWKS